ncbi:hypothetical protein [Paraburkholderia aspalathi]
MDASLLFSIDLGQMRKVPRREFSMDDKCGDGERKRDQGEPENKDQ